MVSQRNLFVHIYNIIYSNQKSLENISNHYVGGDIIVVTFFMRNNLLKFLFNFFNRHSD